MQTVVNGLWIQGKLSALELLTIQSFAGNGFTFQLWTYEPETINAQENVLLRNANEIIPFDRVFSYQFTNIYGHGKGSYAGFSDIFRYKLLYEHGGIWSDMDITCLKPFEIKEDYFFRFHHKTGAVGNFMKCPKNSMLMQWCYEQATEKINENNTDWMLPIKILNEGIKKFDLSEFIQNRSNIDSFPEVSRMLSSSINVPEEWQIIHWMNEEWRRLNISKEKYIRGSLVEQLLVKYNLPHSTFTGIDTLKQNILLSRYHYLLQNIRSTLSWYLSSH